VVDELLYQRGRPPRSRYLFKHALIQDAAYQSLLKRTRQQYHERVAKLLEDRFPEVASTQPELVAHHYTEADLAAQAVAYWQRAGQRAVEHSAYVEAHSHLTKGLAVLQTLPDSLERTQHELGLQTTLGTALIAIKGSAAPEVEHTYTRARELCQHLGDTPRLLQVLLGLHAFYVVRGNFHTARELGEQCLALVQHVHSPRRLLNVHYALGVTLFHRGEFAAARAHLEQGMALYEAQHHRPHPNLQDPGVVCLAYGAYALLVLGYPDQAVTRVQEARLLAQRLAHPFSLAFALNCVTCVHQLRREAQDTQEQAQAAMTLSTEQGFPFWKAYAIVLQGWARLERGQAEGLAQMQQGLSTWQAQGAEVGRTWSLALLAEAYGRVGQTEAGLTVLAEALAAVARMEERFGEAELYRLKGELLLRAGPQPPASEVVPLDAPRPLPDTAAEACFHYAVAIARRQQAKMWELRAVRSLSRLWWQQGKRQAAYALLAPIYGWFTEGFDTADLQEAKALLDALA
jgi:predicted ATPase